MKATIEIPETLFRQAKARAALEGLEGNRDEIVVVQT